MANHGRALMNAANVPKELIFQAATDLDGFSGIVLDVNFATSYEH
jgi:hypothetical protein